MPNNKKILLLPGLDGTGILLRPLQDELKNFECDIATYAENLTSIDAIVDDLSSRYELESYSHFFAESFGTQILPHLLNETKLTDRKAILLAPFQAIPRRFHLLLKLPNVLIRTTYKRAVSTRLLAHYTLGKWATDDLKSDVHSIIYDLDPDIMVERLRVISLHTKWIDIPLPNSLVIKTGKDRLITDSLQNDYVERIACQNTSTIEAPHFAALTHTSQVADLIDSL